MLNATPFGEFGDHPTLLALRWRLRHARMPLDGEKNLTLGHLYLPTAHKVAGKPHRQTLQKKLDQDNA